ncbi:hypothetical protein FB45DRAFT_1061170 [Roridomyces roridus]|uniref:C2H2-type domain-containing protein n=1 Tax=Roridomyces roridus TaxID=1738132 RepID=A0AAD7BJL3_9AGAR|nr:hypothetical protein FB45DRAFT_1061170 [Roridomyces roridus]
MKTNSRETLPRSMPYDQARRRRVGDGTTNPPSNELPESYRSRRSPEQQPDSPSSTAQRRPIFNRVPRLRPYKSLTEALLRGYDFRRDGPLNPPSLPPLSPYQPYTELLCLRGVRDGTINAPSPLLSQLTQFHSRLPHSPTARDPQLDSLPSRVHVEYLQPSPHASRAVDLRIDSPAQDYMADPERYLSSSSDDDDDDDEEQAARPLYTSHPRYIPAQLQVHPSQPPTRERLYHCRWVGCRKSFQSWANRYQHARTVHGATEDILSRCCDDIENRYRM